jgi:hypothetical protein
MRHFLSAHCHKRKSNGAEQARNNHATAGLPHAAQLEAPGLGMVSLRSFRRRLAATCKTSTTTQRRLCRALTTVHDCIRQMPTLDDTAPPTFNRHSRLENECEPKLLKRRTRAAKTTLGECHSFMFHSRTGWIVVFCR